jgi:hypothetical protein
VIASDLKKSGFTHLIIRFDIFKTWSQTVFDVSQRERLQHFLNLNIRLLFAKGGYGLYQLKNQTD